MATPKCGFCKSTEYTAVERSRGGANLYLIVCSACNAILAAVRKD
jgi:hypothetical protein